MRNEPGEKNLTSKKVEFPNPPTDCVIATDQWKLKMFRSQNELPQNVRFGQLFQTVERSNFVFGLILFKMTSYQFVLRFCLKYIGAFTWDALLHSTATTQENRMQVFWETFQKFKLKLKKHLWLKTLKEKVKRITIVKGVCTAYEKSTTAQTNSTNVLHMKRQTWQQHTYGFSMDLLFSMKDDKCSLAVITQKYCQKAKQKTNKQTKNKQNKSTKQKKPQSKRKAQNQNKNSKPRKKQRTKN